MVDLMLCEANRGYHDENWNARIFSGVVRGNRVGWETGDGMVALRRSGSGRKRQSDQSATRRMLIGWPDLDTGGASAMQSPRWIEVNNVRA